MHVGLVISVLLHVAILGWAVVTIQTQREMRVSEPDPVAVDLVEPSEVTKVRQGVRTAKQMDAEAKELPKPDVSKKEAPKPAPLPAKQEPPPEPPKEEVKEAPKPEPPKAEPPKEVAKVEPPKAPEPAPEPKVEPPQATAEPALEQAKLEEKIREEQQRAEEEKKREEQRKADDKRKHDEEQKRLADLKKKKEDDARKKREAELKKKKEDEAKRLAEAKKKEKSFDEQMREMQALLNKVPDKGAPLPNVPTETPSKNKGPALGAKDGRDNQLSASERAILGQIIRSCVQTKWNVLGGGAEAQNIEVKMRLQFTPDGRLAAEPTVTNHQNTPLFMATSDSAVRAVKACEPFPLPAPKYEFWRDMILTFKASDMF